MNTDTLDNIKIEDPLDFLDASEKEEYIRERHRAENERLQKIADAEKKASAAARAMPDRDRERMKRETDDPFGDSRRRSVRRDDYEDDPEDGDYDDDYDEDDEDDYDDEYDDGSRGIIIASCVLGILIVVVILFMLWLRFFMPVPEEPEAEERVREEVALQEEEAEEEEPEEDEIEEETDSEYILPEGFEEVHDTVTVTATTLRMRSEPDSDKDNVVGLVPAGTELTRIAVNRTTGWSAVTLPEFDFAVFCYNQYLEEE